MGLDRMLSTEEENDVLHFSLLNHVTCFEQSAM